MTDQVIISALSEQFPLPSVYRVISMFRCGFQQATRCRRAAEEQQSQKTWTLEDF